jgi:POT family proton-dependent oligopeptide transporter
LSNIILGISFLGVWGLAIWKLTVILPKDNAEIEASWFLILNSLFIIGLAPLFSKWWESKYNPSASMKFGIGMILLGIGFAALAYGASTIPQGALTAKVSLIWLVLAYLLHTMGELCLSPVGLSYVSKLVPAKKIGVMFGVWYLAIAAGNYLAQLVGGYIDVIVERYSMSTFFLIFTLIPIGAGIILLLINPLMKKLMHGVR